MIVPPGVTLRIEPGVVCLFGRGAGISVDGGRLEVNGTSDEPVCFLPADGGTVWSGITGDGPGSVLDLRHFEICAGYVELLDGANGTLDDGFLHDYVEHSPAIIHTRGSPNPVSLVVRRCHVLRYYEILCQLSLNRLEDSLMEHMAAGGDGIDFDGAKPGSLIRRCTVRHGPSTNIDAIDIGEYSSGESSRGVTIADCLLYDFVDKGVSMGVQVDVAVTNCFIHHVDTGLAVKDRSTATVRHTTITASQSGIHAYNKADGSAPDGGGFITEAVNNIFWGNAASLLLENGSALAAHHSDFEGMAVRGEGNMALDPAFVDTVALDCRLSPDSPLRGRGANGENPGAAFPVGAPMALSHPLIDSIDVAGTQVVLHFRADPERVYSLFASEHPAAGAWTLITDVFPLPLPARLSAAADLDPSRSRCTPRGLRTSAGTFLVIS